jgi:hypothetical protein
MRRSGVGRMSGRFTFLGCMLFNPNYSVQVPNWSLEPTPVGEPPVAAQLQR